MTKEIQNLMNKARRSLKAANLLAKDGFYGFAVSRAYYSMFYAAEAVLLSKGLSFSKHSAVIAAFGKEFIKTGLFEHELHQNLFTAFDLRNLADYGEIDSVDKDKAMEVIENAVHL